jgi:hypothetical protein
MRSNKLFRASSVGAISDGTPATATGCSACGVRAFSSSPSRRMGAKPCRTAHQAAAASTGSATSSGHSMPRSTAHRMARRDPNCSPISTSTSR